MECQNDLLCELLLVYSDFIIISNQLSTPLPSNEKIDSRPLLNIYNSVKITQFIEKNLMIELNPISPLKLSPSKKKTPTQSPIIADKSSSKQIRLFFNKTPQLQNWSEDFRILNNLNSHKPKDSTYIQTFANTFYIMNQNIEFIDSMLHLISITSFFEDSSEGKVRNLSTYIHKYDLELPWEKEIYKEELIKTYNKNNIHLNIKQFFEKFGEINLFDKNNDYISIKEYAPGVFQHIRFIDKVDIRSIICSINPLFGMKEITENYKGTYNSALSLRNLKRFEENKLLFSHDKKFIIKKVTKSEKNHFLQFLPHYHEKLRDTKSFMERIYGIYSIQISKKKNCYIILMKNMNVISKEVIKLK